MKQCTLACLLLLVGCDSQVISEGSRVGVISKVSHKLLCNSDWNWEGELAMAAGTTASGQGGEGNNAVSSWAFAGPSLRAGFRTQAYLNGARSEMGREESRRGKQERLRHFTARTKAPRRDTSTALYLAACCV